METIVVTVKGVKVFVDQKSADVQLTFSDTIKGVARNDEGEFVETDVKKISIKRKKLTFQLCEASDDIAMYRATLDHSFGQKEFGVILFNAKLTLNRTRITAGEVVKDDDETIIAEHDGYITDVTAIKLSDRALDQLEKATAL